MAYRMPWRYASCFLTTPPALSQTHTETTKHKHTIPRFCQMSKQATHALLGRQFSGEEAEAAVRAAAEAAVAGCACVRVSSELCAS